ncbi:MAG TPA: putative Ig domain-containing protein [Leptospiraceae bacterium]|nr:putative Ig domain-containing protein [Leptospiraceae bacterium]HNA09644.1 putative Ig domain-containing protein [Leptospiraceae bacterium]HNC58865.1 putative Ig domain-containing protein [Leptospiraceae bacterium]HNE10981.1 putative Ig domain-containing protein [Leptospiraceae bacterium]HNE55642.1 putative Ig domain-containing protein [Leptospiraceae bacterium]
MKSKIWKFIVILTHLNLGYCLDPSLKQDLNEYIATLLALKKEPPLSILYSNSPYTFTKDLRITTITPITTGLISSCISKPELPIGLVLNPINCSIEGTPTQIQEEKSYTITASNSSGKSAFTTILIAINMGPPSTLVYSGSPYIYTVNLPINPNTPTITETFTNCVSNPPLPQGLSLNPTTCAISGTPTIIQTATNYTITATNLKGDSTATITITVKFMREWPEIQPILIAQAALGSVATETVGVMGSNYGGVNKWYGAVLAPNGKIYGIPRSATTILIIDPATDTTSTIPSPDLSGIQKWIGGVLAPNGKIYGIPNAGTSILVIDPNTNTATTFGSFIGGGKWVGGVLAPNGKIYCIPADSTSVLVIDPATDTTYTFGSLSGTVAKWYGGVLAPNGKIYGIPNNETSVLVIDPNTDSISTFGSLVGGNKWRGGVIAPNGKIYGIPANSATILEIDPTNDTTVTFGALGGTTLKWQGGVLSTNGKIYGIPYNTDRVLILDPTTNTTAISSSLGGTFRWTTGALAPNGKIYGMPANNGQTLVIDPTSNGTWPSDLYLSPYFNKL